MADSDGDVYHYKDFNESKKIEAQEALDALESRIKKTFIKFQVKKKDHVYKIAEIFHVALRFEHAMRNIQTSDGPFKRRLWQIFR